MSRRAWSWEGEQRVSQPDPNAARALAAAITSSKRSPGAPLREQRSGRIDRTVLHRVATGDCRVFARPAAPAPQRLRVIVLLDASGSMKGRNATVAMQMGRNLADAFALLPNVRADIWAHTTGYIEDVDEYGDKTVRTSVKMFPLWSTGQPSHRINQYNQIAYSGNIDGFAIAYVGDELRASIRPGEQGLILVVSDGAPAYGAHGDAELHMRLVREDLKRSGIPVVSVSVAGAMNAETQAVLYGHGNYILYNPNPRVTARDMAKVIGHNLG